jgi:hypothetical protein
LFSAFTIDWSSWQPWALLLVGCAVSFVLGRASAGRRAPAADLPPAELPEPAAAEPPPAAAGGDQRRSVRRRGNSVDVFFWADGTAPARGKVLDRSQGGLCLEVGQALTPGTVLHVRSCYAPEHMPGVRVEVRFCRPGKATWEAGCRFVGVPNWSELLLFG